jgi:GNAT superfamily N-acetyltransferase
VHALTRHTYFAAWALSHPVFFWAFSYSEFPNQIHFAYTALVFLLGLALLPAHTPLALLRRKLPGLELTVLIAVYLAALWVVSTWEVIPGTAAPYFRFEAIHLVVALNAYVIGRALTGREILKGHALLGLVLMAATLAQMALDPDLSRYGYGMQLMLCTSAMLVLGWRWAAAGALIVIMASLHKTTLGCALLGVLVVFWWAKIPPQKGNKYVRAIYPLLALVVVAGGVIYLAPMIGATIERFLPEGMHFYGLVGEHVDRQRGYITDLSLDLLPEYWLTGMGYMNFYALTATEATTLYAIDRFGVEVYGTSLHNSYMTWALEGGLLVMLAVALIFWRAGARIRFIWSAEPNMGVLLLAWCVSALLFGWFHQLHASVQFWSILGIIFGYRDQLAARLPLVGRDMPLAHSRQPRTLPEDRCEGLPVQSR